MALDPDPEPELQKAVLARLLATAALTAIVSTRIWDRPPANVAANYPYVTLGESQVLPDNGDCYAGSEVNFVINGWSQRTTREEIKRIGAAIRRALDDEPADPLMLTNHSVVSCQFVRSDVFLDEDGRTQRIAVRFRALTEPTTD